jgi:hypothetical protein
MTGLLSRPSTSFSLRVSNDADDRDKSPGMTNFDAWHSFRTPVASDGRRCASSSLSANPLGARAVDDPLERANLKERHKDVYDRMVAAWQAWNASMLPEVAERVAMTALQARRMPVPG